MKIYEPANIVELGQAEELVLGCIGSPVDNCGSDVTDQQDGD
jgi:hypothetical protein